MIMKEVFIKTLAYLEYVPRGHAETKIQITVILFPKMQAMVVYKTHAKYAALLVETTNVNYASLVGIQEFLIVRHANNGKLNKLICYILSKTLHL